MAKNKNEEYFKKKIEEIKTEKRALGHIPSSQYGKITNKEIKKEKEILKTRRRAVKHSENFEIKKFISQEVEKFKKNNRK